MSPFKEGLWLYWRQKVVQHHINKVLCTVFVVFLLFCPNPVHPLCWISPGACWYCLVGSVYAVWWVSPVGLSCCNFHWGFSSWCLLHCSHSVPWICTLRLRSHVWFCMSENCGENGKFLWPVKVEGLWILIDFIKIKRTCWTYITLRFR
jgi:hypothetical protein